MGASGEPPAAFGRYKNTFLSETEYAELEAEYPDRLERFLEEMSRYLAATGQPDYTGEDGLLYCGKCRKPREAYFPESKTLFGRDRHPAECDCQRASREEREAAGKQYRHREEVERLKRRGFTDPAMRGWTFENDNGKCPQMTKAR